jgi:hypothetical protein
MRTMCCSPPDAGRRPLSSALMAASQSTAAAPAVPWWMKRLVKSSVQEGAVCDEQSGAGFEGVDAGCAGA